MITFTSVGIYSSALLVMMEVPLGHLKWLRKCPNWRRWKMALHK